jgi:hypothetical protein
MPALACKNLPWTGGFPKALDCFGSLKSVSSHAGGRAADGAGVR